MVPGIREGSNGHKSISRNAVMKIMMSVIDVDGFYVPDCDTEMVAFKAPAPFKVNMSVCWGAGLF